MTDQVRINEDELEWDGDVSTLDGLPYSGTAFLAYSDGSLKREATFKNGFEDGLYRGWPRLIQPGRRSRKRLHGTRVFQKIKACLTIAESLTINSTATS